MVQSEIQLRIFGARAYLFDIDDLGDGIVGGSPDPGTYPFVLLLGLLFAVFRSLLSFLTGRLLKKNGFPSVRGRTEESRFLSFKYFPATFSHRPVLPFVSERRRSDRSGSLRG